MMPEWLQLRRKVFVQAWPLSRGAVAVNCCSYEHVFLRTWPTFGSCTKAEKWGIIKDVLGRSTTRIQSGKSNLERWTRISDRKLSCGKCWLIPERKVLAFQTLCKRFFRVTLNMNCVNIINTPWTWCNFNVAHRYAKIICAWQRETNCVSRQLLDRVNLDRVAAASFKSNAIFNGILPACSHLDAIEFMNWFLVYLPPFLWPFNEAGTVWPYVTSMMTIRVRT